MLIGFELVAISASFDEKREEEEEKKRKREDRNFLLVGVLQKNRSCTSWLLPSS